MSNTNSTLIHFKFHTREESLESICEALAEGDHEYGDVGTLAGYAVIQWPAYSFSFADISDILIVESVG